jgi:tetratricopeptide (TPR) repeat protein
MNPGYRTIHVFINHVNTLTDTRVMRICVTDTNTTHGLCYYMNPTEVEAQIRGNDVNVSAGSFTFPIDQAQFSTENEIQVCLKVLDLHSEQCTSYNINFAAENETLSIDRRDLVPVSSKGTLYDKGNALIEQGNYTQAIQSFDKALAIDPNDKYALEGKGYALHNLGNYTEAIQYYDKALAIDPNDKYALNSKGGVLDSLGNHTHQYNIMTRLCL